MPWGIHNVTVWTHPEEAITPSISASDDMGPGKAYSFTITLTPPNKHYSIESASVEVDGQTAQAEFDRQEDGSAVLSVAGTLPMSAGEIVTTEVSFKGKIWKFAKGRLWQILTPVGIYNGVKHVNKARIRGQVQGLVKCASADRATLETGPFKTPAGYTVQNECTVRYFIYNKNGSVDETKRTKTNYKIRTTPRNSNYPVQYFVTPYYRFTEVACARDVYVQVVSALNYHDHSDKGWIMVGYGSSHPVHVGKIGSTYWWSLGMPPAFHYGDTLRAPDVLAAPSD